MTKTPMRVAATKLQSVFSFFSLSAEPTTKIAKKLSQNEPQNKVEHDVDERYKAK
jgi:hypothetical protein